MPRCATTWASLAGRAYSPGPHRSRPALPQPPCSTTQSTTDRALDGFAGCSAREGSADLGFHARRKRPLTTMSNAANWTKRGVNISISCFFRNGTSHRMSSAITGSAPSERAAARSMAALLWHPTADQIARSNLAAFMQFVADRGSPAMSEYAELYQWSIDEPRAFWAAVWDFCGVVASRRYDSIVEHFDRMPGAQWFPGARLNYAENLLRFRDDRPALVA